jgi:hypothetical protein
MMMMMMMMMIVIYNSELSNYTDIAVPFTHNHPYSVAENITKYVNLALEIKDIWTLNNPHTTSSSQQKKRSPKTS